MTFSTKNRTNSDRPQFSCVGTIVSVLVSVSLLAATSVAQEKVPTADGPRESVEVAIATPLSENKSNPIENVNVTVMANTAPLDDRTPVFRIVDRDLAKSRIAELVSETKTAMWKTKIMERMEEEVEHSSIITAWAGPDLQRIKVKSGRGAGKTLLVRGEMVSSGWLKFRHTNSMVKTVRGNSLKLNGYLDDLSHLLTDWDSVTLTDEAGNWIIEFVATNGVNSKLWIDSTTLKASKLEAREDGALVGLYEYESVIYNPKLPASYWKK